MITMKRFISTIMAVALLVGCATVTFSDLQITGAATVGAKAALYAIPTAQKAAVKNWMFYIATKARTLSGNATPQELNDLLVSSIPANILTEIPELKAVVIPAIVDVYKTFYDQFSTNHTRLLQILNDIATGVEAAAASI